MPSECRRTEAGEAVLHARSWHARLLDAVAAASGMTPINACEVAREVDELETRRSVFSHIERGLTATFWRHDHLEGRRFGRLAGSNCDGWAEPSFLRNYSVVLLSRGAHLNEYDVGERGSRAFHSQRAESLVSLWGAAAPNTTLVYVKAHWGTYNTTRMSPNESASQASIALDASVADAMPAAAAAAAAAGDAAVRAKPVVFEGNLPQHFFNWHLIPMINEATVSVLRRRLPSARAKRLARSRAACSSSTRRSRLASAPTATTMCCI